MGSPILRHTHVETLGTPPVPGLHLRCRFQRTDDSTAGGGFLVSGWEGCVSVCWAVGVLGCCVEELGQRGRLVFLRVASPFFPGILLSRKPPKTLTKQLVLENNDG